MRLALEYREEYPSRWAATEAIAPKTGYVPQTLLECVKRHAVDSGARAGLSTVENERITDLEREIKELHRANEILKLAGHVGLTPRTVANFTAKSHGAAVGAGCPAT